MPSFTRYSLGCALMFRGDKDAAYDEMRTSAEIDQQWAEPLVVMAAIMFGQHNFTKAIMHLEHAKQLCPARPDIDTKLESYRHAKAAIRRDEERGTDDKVVCAECGDGRASKRCSGCFLVSCTSIIVVLYMFLKRR